MLTRLPFTSMWPWRTSWRACDAREREAEAVHDVVEARLEEAEHLLARAALPAGRVEVVLAELALEDAVDAAHLLLLAQADAYSVSLMRAWPCCPGGYGRRVYAHFSV